MLDLLLVAKQELEAAGLTPCYITLPTQAAQEFIALTMGDTLNEVRYFDGVTESELLVLVYVKRRKEQDAIETAERCEQVLAGARLDSQNGTYTLNSVKTSMPHGLPFDPSGFYLSVFEMRINITRKGV